jgi:O-antigen/teichoic acid export membrane protein
MEFVSLGQILNSILLLSGALFAINQDLGVIGMASVYASATAVSLLYSSVVSMWKFPRPRLEIDLDFWKQALKQAWPFGLAGVFATLYYWVDSLMLSAMKGDEAIGWYNAAYRLVLVLSVIPAAYFSAVFPVMSRFHISSQESLRFIYERSFKYLLILAVPIGVGTTLLANKIILLIFGSGYFPSIVALQILVWSMVFIFVSWVFGQLFNSVNKQIISTSIVISTTVLNVILNLILIPRYSLNGASISTVAAMSVGFALNYFLSARIGFRISTKNLIKMIAKVSISSAIMCVFVLYLKNFYILALVPLSALLYFAVLYIIGGIDNEDRLLLREVVGRR